jgi:hypothetical protein
MAKLAFAKSTWDGNHWPSIEFAPYEYGDFLVVVTHLCADFGASVPEIIDTLDGYIADIVVDGTTVELLLDNWTFSLATQSEALRDRIFDSLLPLAA